MGCWDQLPPRHFLWAVAVAGRGPRARPEAEAAVIMPQDLPPQRVMGVLEEAGVDAMPAPQKEVLEVLVQEVVEPPATLAVPATVAVAAMGLR